MHGVKRYDLSLKPIYNLKIALPPNSEGEENF